jgi:hypothetical protein
LLEAKSQQAIQAGDIAAAGSLLGGAASTATDYFKFRSAFGSGSGGSSPGPGSGGLY